MKSTPLYIKNLLLPNAKSPTGRRVWGLDLETVWLPFLMATNAMGDTAVPADALGSPIRLAYDKDGEVKFSKSGRPISRVAKPISDNVTLIRQNFVATLQQYTEQVAESNKEEYAKVVTSARIAGEPIINHDKAELSKAIQLQVEEALRATAEAEPVATPTPEPEAEAVPVA